MSVNDEIGESHYQYSYDRLGRVQSTIIHNGGAPITTASEYDAQSRKTEHTVTVGGQPDYRNEYEYDALHRLTQFRQGQQAGGRSVTEKRFDYGYNAASQLVSIDRFSDLAGAATVTSSVYAYDGQARLAQLDHFDRGGVKLAGYRFTYDVGSRLSRLESHLDGLSEFGYDHGNQLLSGGHTSQPDETYRYDENGNRASEAYQTGDHNRLTADEQFEYRYDGEGNRVLRIDKISGAVTEYLWDHRNRLTAVIDRDDAAGAASQHVAFRYDPFDRWISSSQDIDGDGPLSATVALLSLAVVLSDVLFSLSTAGLP